MNGLQFLSLGVLIQAAVVFYVLARQVKLRKIIGSLDEEVGGLEVAVEQLEEKQDEFIRGCNTSLQTFNSRTAHKCAGNLLRDEVGLAFNQHQQGVNKDLAELRAWVRRLDRDVQGHAVPLIDSWGTDGASASETFTLRVVQPPEDLENVEAIDCFPPRLPEESFALLVRQ